MVQSFNSQFSNKRNHINSVFQNAKDIADNSGINLSSNSDNIVSKATINDVSSSNKKKYTKEELEQLIKEYNSNITALNEKINKLNSEIQQLQSDLSSEQQKYDSYKSSYESKENEYKNLESNYKGNESKYTYINNLIEQATERAEADLKAKQQSAIYKAMANYNKEDDGNYSVYLKKSLKGIVADTSITSLIDGLSLQSQSLLKELGTLKTQMADASTEMNNYKSKMASENTIINQLKNNISIKESEKSSATQELNSAKQNLSTAQTELTNLQNVQNANLQTIQNINGSLKDLNNNITTNEIAKTDISNMSADELNELAKKALDSISDEEKALVAQNNIDLTAKFPDGSPKYLIAVGKGDNKYHIYEMDSQGGCRATSLARKYAPNRGLDIVASGNGYMYNIGKNTDDATKTNVFNLTCVSDDLSTCKAECNTKNYCTCSPLSLDIDGDGVSTSEEEIYYDINGDGKLDKINNSADAVLVFDADGNGISGENGKECFGDNTDLDGDGKADGYKDGFEALKALARKENLINGIDDNKLDINDIKFLEEKYGLKLKLKGYNDEAISLLDAGITEINLSITDETRTQKNFDGLYNDLMTQEGATFKIDGEEHEYADLWHNINLNA